MKFDYYIIIHCVHGSNRTGFAISYFLYEKFGFSISDAINIFEAARGSKIKRQAVKDNLVEKLPEALSTKSS